VSPVSSTSRCAPSISWRPAGGDERVARHARVEICIRARTGMEAITSSSPLVSGKGSQPDGPLVAALVTEQKSAHQSREFLRYVPKRRPEQRRSDVLHQQGKQAQGPAIGTYYVRDLLCARGALRFAEPPRWPVERCTERDCRGRELSQHYGPRVEKCGGRIARPLGCAEISAPQCCWRLLAVMILILRR
jgi:hypothetical protein